MIFCIDCDNVLCNLQEAVLNVFNAVYDKNYTLETFDKYSVSECIPKEDAINMISIYNKEGIYDLVKPLQGAQNAIKKLIRAGHEVYIVTDFIFFVSFRYIFFIFLITQLQARGYQERSCIPRWQE